MRVMKLIDRATRIRIRRKSQLNNHPVVIGMRRFLEIFTRRSETSIEARGCKREHLEVSQQDFDPKVLVQCV